MRTIVLGLGVVLLAAGCGGKGGGFGASESPLTQDQRTAWEKFRNAQGKGGVNIVALRADGWNIWHPGESSWAARLPTFGGQMLAEEPTGVENLASKWAALPGNKMTAVVNLCDSPDPQIVCWFIDDGKGAKKLQAAPSPDHEKTLRTFLLSLQRSAGG
jgi:hypothetical protein